MASEIRVPRLGWSMEVGTFVGWLKQDGDLIKEGDTLYELEGEKASQEIESIDEGILRIPPDAPAPGTELPVGALLAYLVALDEPLPWESRGKASVSTPGQASEGETPRCRVPSSPSARKRARELNIALHEIVGSGKAGRISRNDVERFARQARSRGGASVTAGAATTAADHHATGARIVATPRARRVAHELAVDWRQLRGTGRQGRIRESDVRLAAVSFAAAAGDSAADSGTDAQAVQRSPVGTGAVGTGAVGTGATEQVTRMRRVIAQRMLASHQATVPVTLTTQASAGNLQHLRAQFKASGESLLVPSLNDIIIKLVAGVLRTHLVMAGQWHQDRIVLPGPDGIHIGLAVDTKAGLFVPVVHNASQKSLIEIAQTSSRLIEQARAGELALDQLQGGVFTITNLGPFGIDAFTPVINTPEAAILGIGTIRREAIVADDDQIAIGSRITLSLTFDHRVVDGAPAARFLAEVRAAIENPVPHLI